MKRIRPLRNPGNCPSIGRVSPIKVKTGQRDGVQWIATFGRGRREWGFTPIKMLLRATGG